VRAEALWQNGIPAGIAARKARAPSCWLADGSRLAASALNAANAPLPVISAAATITHAAAHLGKRMAQVRSRRLLPASSAWFRGVCFGFTTASSGQEASENLAHVPEKVATVSGKNVHHLDILKAAART